MTVPEPRSGRPGSAAAIIDPRPVTAAGGAVVTNQQSPAAGAASAASAGRVELREGLAWMALGVAILVLALRMDRLADQGVPPYAAPGLVPGLLGIAMILFGFLVALRVRQQRDSGAAIAAEAPARRVELRPGRLALVIGLCLTFSVGLIGHGLPFWVASSLFVAVSIIVLQYPDRQAAGRGLDARALVVAGVIGLGAGGGATLVFQRLFLVHLP